MHKVIFVPGLLCSLFSLVVTAQNNTTNYGLNSGSQGNNNTFFGSRSGQSTTSNNNSFFGFNSGFSNISGTANNFVGVNSGRQNIEGRNNNFFGVNTGFENTLGINNIYIGSNAGRYNQTGNNNVFLGHSAGQGPNDLSSSNRTRNTYLGAMAGRDATGSRNVFIGFQAGMAEIGNNKLHINNADNNLPLVFGDFSSGQLGINTTSLVDDMALSIGGNAAVDGNLIANGKIAIGTTSDDPGFDLTVKGKIHVQEIKVDLLGAIAPDYVFHENYELLSLVEVEDYIIKEGHLSNIPSAAEMEKNGIYLKEMNLKLLEKIEELTLYVIAQDKLIKKQQVSEASFEKRLQLLESNLNED